MKSIAPSLLLVVSASLAGCFAATEDEALERECRALASLSCDDTATGETRRFAIDGLTFSSVPPLGDPAILEGFDLDCRRSSDEDAEGCFTPDYTSPDGAPGVDNQAAGLFVTLGLGPARLDAGTFVVEVSGVDDPERDECVSVRLRTATRDSTGALEVGGELGASTGATLEDGRLVARFEALSLAYRFSSRLVPDGTLVLQMADVRLAFDMREDGLANGVIGGSILAEQIGDDYAALDPGIPTSVARSVTEAQADLQPNPDTGYCDRLSVGMTASAVAL